MRHAREANRIAEGVEWYEANRGALASLPHPREWHAAQGKTAADCVDWTLENAGNAGKLQTLKWARSAVARGVSS